MKYFAELFHELEETDDLERREIALLKYFHQSSKEDILWTITLLMNKRLGRVVQTSILKTWACQKAEIPIWLFEASNRLVGDVAETISLILNEKKHQVEKPLTEWIHFIKHLKTLKEEEKESTISLAWEELDSPETYIFNKLITGGFRIKIPQRLLTKSLSKFLDQAENEVAFKLISQWSPEKDSFDEIFCSPETNRDTSKPYPFFLAQEIDLNIEKLDLSQDWIAEWKWDGIRVQIIHRSQYVFIWSQEKELLNLQFPEISKMIKKLPNGTVIDGVLLAFKNGNFLQRSDLLKRKNSAKASNKLIQDVPVVFMAFDMLESHAKDIRTESCILRRKKLQELIVNLAHSEILLSTEIEFDNWETLHLKHQNSQNQMADGLILKRKDSLYLEGQLIQHWKKWKRDPYMVKAILLYARRGLGPQSKNYVEFTFAVWNEDQLIPFTKATQGLSKEDLIEISLFIKNNTIERFGPVRSIKAELVFEISFEGIQKSNRTKSGISLRSSKIAKWRKDIKAEKADSLSTLKKLL